MASLDDKAHLLCTQGSVVMKVMSPFRVALWGQPGTVQLPVSDRLPVPQLDDDLLQSPEVSAPRWAL
jgi:hypothetical protein